MVEEESPNAMLQQNYPNPFNPTTNIQFDLDKEAEVSLKVFDMSGQEVATLVSGIRREGVHVLSWNGANMPSGMYYYQLVVGEELSTKQMTLMK